MTLISAGLTKPTALCSFNFAAIKNQQLSDFVKLLLCKYKTYINQLVTFQKSLPLDYYNGLVSLAITGFHQIYPSQYRHQYRLQKNA
jgi:hypothetical protein